MASGRPLWVLSEAVRLPVILPPDFRFGRLFFGMAFLRRLIFPRPRVPVGTDNAIRPGGWFPSTGLLGFRRALRAPLTRRRKAMAGLMGEREDFGEP